MVSSRVLEVPTAPCPSAHWDCGTLYSPRGVSLDLLLKEERRDEERAEAELKEKPPVTRLLLPAVGREDEGLTTRFHTQLMRSRSRNSCVITLCRFTHTRTRSLDPKLHQKKNTRRPSGDPELFHTNHADIQRANRRRLKPKLFKRSRFHRGLCSEISASSRVAVKAQ